MTSPTSILKHYWGYNTFRPLQKEIIESVLNGHDTLALLPTGGGKSICFQVPALAKEGLCLVISPLIALMKDQVENLRKKNITAFAIYSGMSRKEVINTMKVAANSNCKFLYVSPERLETSLFLEYLPAFNIQLLAVDEAHCISQWGYDFRPPYLRIATLRKELPEVPVLALTASATPDVQKDICEKLESPSNPNSIRTATREPSSTHHYQKKNNAGTFFSWNIFRQSFERQNLSYSVFKVDSKINKIVEILQKVPGSGIVYCKSRRKTKEISDLLNLQGIASDFYHAGLAQEERNNKQQAWINNHLRTIVCTNAFGMGIDKPDVRTVVHADVPDCLENYYQEAGRAGRDNRRAYAVLLHSEKELSELKKLSAIRFPSVDDIRIIYQSLMNYLQIPTGGGEGNYYDFDIVDFIKKFSLNAPLVTASLKVLEQEEILSFNEQVFLPSRLQFVTNKDILYDFENNSPSLEPIIKVLLRTYEGVFDQPVAIHEKTIADLLHKSLGDVINELKRLHTYSIVQYTPQKNTPQVFLIQDRSKAEDLYINQVNYRKRKEQFEIRIESLLNYIKKESGCRSKIIASYFGDNSIPPCGICDNCLQHKKRAISPAEFEKIYERILFAVQPQPLHSKDLLKHLEGIKKEKAWKVIEFLQAENKIAVDKQGFIKLTPSLNKE